MKERPGAFEHAVPIRRWRKEWPQAYETLLAELRERWPEGRGVREFVEILALHRDYPARKVEQAVQEALALGAAHLDGVRLCLLQQAELHTPPPALDLSAHPHLQGIGEQAVDLAQYDRLLQAGVR